jgi:hypothetical protein
VLSSQFAFGLLVLDLDTFMCRDQILVTFTTQHTFQKKKIKDPVHIHHNLVLQIRRYSVVVITRDFDM